MNSDEAKGRGYQAFHQHYSQIYGLRWEKILDSLLQEGVKITYPEPIGDYELDPASAWVVTHFEFSKGDQVLDLCSAPGGKALGLMLQGQGEILLTCNELSMARWKRLQSVMRNFLPQEWRAQVRIERGDGSRYGMRRSEEFDHVLVDAPCSGERHLLQTPKELNQWSRARGKRLIPRQTALICSGFDALKAGGTMIYSTCTINPAENDGVVEKLLKKREAAEIVELLSDYGEPTKWGKQIFPMDKGWGPIYAAKISKKYQLQNGCGTDVQSHEG